jgi:hypothetical protein
MTGQRYLILNRWYTRVELVVLLTVVFRLQRSATTAWNTATSQPWNTVRCVVAVSFARVLVAVSHPDTFICHTLTKLTNSMEQSLSWETDCYSASQEFPSTSWNMKGHYRSLKCPPPVPALVQIQSMPPHHTSWRLILILSSHLRLGFPSGLFWTIGEEKYYWTTICRLSGLYPILIITIII